MIITTNQPSFSSGEISPSLYSRIDINKYNTALKKCINFYPHLTGGISRRTGTRFIAKTKYYDDPLKKVKLIPFEVSTQDTYMLEFGDYYIRFYKNKSQIALSTAEDWQTSTTYLKGDYVKENSKIYYCLISNVSGVFAIDLANGKWIEQSIYEVPTIYSYIDINKIKFIQSVDVLFITHPDYPTQQLSRFTDTNWVFSDYDYTVPPFMLSNKDSLHTLSLSAEYGTGITLTSSLSLFESGNIGSSYKIYHSLPSQAVSLNITGTGNSGNIKCDGTWRIRCTGIVNNLTIKLQQSIDNGTTWTDLRTYDIKNSEINDYGTLDYYCLLRVNCSSFTSGSSNMTLSSDPFTKAGIIKITSITNDKIAIGDITEQFADKTASDDWAESCWSERRGYPSNCAFFQDRFVLANTKTQKQTTWLSKTGDYYSFDVSKNIKDDDAISSDLNSRKLNEIQNIILLRDLLILTTSSEWRLGTVNGIVTPTTLSQGVQGNRGSNDVMPVLVGNKIIYLQSSGQILRDLGYDYNSESFTGSYISILSSHLFINYNIIDMDYLQEPDSLVYLVRNDGKIIIMNYMIEQDILGFTLHETQGFFENTAVLNTNTGNQCWVSVLRENGRFIEVFEDNYVEVEDQWYLDSALKYEGVATDTLSGLEHLNGMTVNVLGNGNVIKTLNDVERTPLVVENGELILPYEVEKAIVGLQYISELETLPPNIDFQDGNIKSKKYKISQLSIIFENSRGGFIGDRDIELDKLIEIIDKRIFFDLPIGYNVNQRFNIDINSSWGYDRTLIFKQYDPLPTNILSIIPKIIIGG